MTKRTILLAAVAIIAFGLPIATNAQGIVRGATQGANEGNRAAGPVGGVVGGVVGAVGGGVAGLLGVDQRPRFRDYAIGQHHESYTYRDPIVVGGVLPREGVTYYDVPSEYGVEHYRYTIINGQPVLVDPNTGRIVQILE